MFDLQLLHTALFGYALIGALGSVLLAPLMRRKSDAYLLPALIAGGMAIGSFLKNRSANKAQKSQLEQANKNAEAVATAKQGLFDALKARGIDPYGPQVSTIINNMSQSISSRVRPIIEAEARPLADKTRSYLESIIGKDLYGAKQVAEEARQGAQGARAAVTAAQAAGGGRLSAPQMAALAKSANEKAIGNTLSFRAGLDEKNRAANMEATGAANRLIQSLYLGSQSNQNTTGTSTQTSTAPPNLTALWSVLNPSDTAKVSTETGYSPWGNAIGAGAQGLAAYYSMTQPKPAAAGGAAGGVPGVSPGQCPPGAPGVYPSCY